MSPTAPLLAGMTSLAAATGPWAGKLAFISVFVLLLVWLVLMPSRLVGDAPRRARWWRNARVWAIVVTCIQILIYLRWG